MDKLDVLIKDVAYIKAIINMSVALVLLVVGCTFTLIVADYFFAS